MHIKILLTGASSYVGARLFLDLSKKFDVIGTYHGNRLSNKFIHLDVTNLKEIEEVIGEEKPDIIIHAAANANARWCEVNPGLAFNLNQESTKNVVRFANKIKAKVFLISSFAAIKPDNVYGQTKRQSEEYIKQTEAGFVIFRPSLIIGFSPNTTNDRPFNRMLKNLDEKTEAVYDTSWKFQPTYLRHISEVIEEVIDKTILNETIPIAVPELKSRYDLAKDILQVFGIQVMPIDKDDKTAVITDKLEKLKSLKLIQYSYKTIITDIISEINQREFFTLS